MIDLALVFLVVYVMIYLLADGILAALYLLMAMACWAAPSIRAFGQACADLLTRPVFGWRGGDIENESGYPLLPQSVSTPIKPKPEIAPPGQQSPGRHLAGCHIRNPASLHLLLCIRYRIGNGPKCPGCTCKAVKS